MREGHNNVIYRSDYQAPAFWIDNVDLTFDLDPAKTREVLSLSLCTAITRIHSSICVSYATSCREKLHNGVSWAV